MCFTWEFSVFVDNEKNPSKKSKAYSMIDYTTQYNFSGGLVFVDN